MYLDSKAIYFDCVYVVFVDETTLKRLRFLKRGFRHCYVVLDLGDNRWLEINPMSNRLFVSTHQFGSGFDCISYLQKQKRAKVCKIELRDAPLSLAPLGLLTCVGFIKRLIGLRKRSILTPHQLYKHLIRVGNKS